MNAKSPGGSPTTGGAHPEGTQPGDTGEQGRVESSSAVAQSKEHNPGAEQSGTAAIPADQRKVSEQPLLDSARQSPRNVRHRQQVQQSVSLTVLASLAVLATMYAAGSLLLPIVLALVLALTLRPVLRWMNRHGMPPFGAAALLIILMLSIAALGITYLVGPAKMWIDDAPQKLQAAGQKLSVIREQINELEAASDKIKDLAEGEPVNQKTGVAALIDRFGEEEDEPMKVEVRQPRLVSNLMILNSAGNFLAAAVVTVVLTFFLLSSGDMLINNVLRILPTIREKRNAVELVHSVERGISSYLLTVTFINVCLGVAIALAMWALQLPNPALWGMMATLFNFVPYIGAMAGTLIVFLVAVLEFESLAYAALVPAVYFSITALEGNIVTPSVLGHRMSLNPILVFLSLVFWGWMWGVGGALLAVPILAILKVGFDSFERTKPIGTLLGT